MNPFASTPVAPLPDRPFDVLLDRFAGSVPLFHERLVRPALAEVLCTDPAEADLRYDPNRGGLVDRGMFAATPVASGSGWYAPLVTAVTAVVLGDALGVSVRGECDLGAGILLGFHVTARCALVTGPVHGDVTFAPDPEPDVRHAADIPWWFGRGARLVDEITGSVTTAVAHELPDALNTRLAA